MNPWRSINTLTWHELEPGEYETDYVILGWEETADTEGDARYGRGLNGLDADCRLVETWNCNDGRPGNTGPPTHWMPMPEPPKGARMSEPVTVTIRIHNDWAIGFVEVSACGPDGNVITAHTSSSREWAKIDIQRPSHLKAIAAKYPDYRLMLDGEPLKATPEGKA